MMKMCSLVLEIQTMKKLFIISVFIINAASLSAAESAFQLSLTPDIAIHPKTTQINGVALDIWGENPQHSLNLGFVNGSTGDSCGFTWGFFNYADSYTGVSWGLVNYSKTGFVGWQGGLFFFPCLVNVSKGTFTGFQEGVVNYAQEFHGFQLALVNYTENLHGVQIGLVNIAMNNGWFDQFPDQLAKGFPIVNWSF
jgi:hypothetical protein